MRATCVLLLAGLSLPAFAQNGVSVPARREYVDSANGVRFNYSASWQLGPGVGSYIPPAILENDKNPAEALQADAIVVLKGRDAENGPYAHTNFISGIFYYRLASELTEKQCYARADSLAEDKGKVDRAEIHGVRYAHGHVDGQALCNESTQDLYATFRSGRCYLFEKQVSTICQHAELRDITPGELKEINRELSQIMVSVQLRNK